MQPRVESIQVGRPQYFAAEGDSSQPWSSAIIKQIVTGRVFVGFNGLEGDEQSDLIHHGGLDKAVLAYASTHYGFWTNRYPDCVFTAGAFGENLTVTGIDEAMCCLGNVKNDLSGATVAKPTSRELFRCIVNHFRNLGNDLSVCWCMGPKLVSCDRTGLGILVRHRQSLLLW